MAERNEKLYLKIKEIHNMCHEKRIKNVKRKTKEQLLEELGIDPKKIAKPPRSTSITSGVTTDYESIYRCGKDLGISLRTIGSKNKGEPEKLTHCSEQLAISYL